MMAKKHPDLEMFKSRGAWMSCQQQHNKTSCGMMLIRVQPRPGGQPCFAQWTKPFHAQSLPPQLHCRLKPAQVSRSSEKLPLAQTREGATAWSPTRHRAKSAEKCSVCLSTGWGRAGTAAARVGAGACQSERCSHHAHGTSMWLASQWMQ